MTQSALPVAKRPDVKGPFETAMALGMRLPGNFGFIARRKLKRRQCARMQDTFSQVLADTGAGDLCIDLGANVGSITRRMAQSGADVISFEPDPGAYEALQKATADLPNVTLVHKAAGHQADSLFLHRSAKWSPDDPAGHTEGSSLVHRDQGADNLLKKLVDHPILSRIDCIFVETHERQDPKRYVPLFDELQDWAERIEKPYVNLYWV